MDGRTRAGADHCPVLRGVQQAFFRALPASGFARYGASLHVCMRACVRVCACVRVRACAMALAALTARLLFPPLVLASPGCVCCDVRVAHACGKAL